MRDEIGMLLIHPSSLPPSSLRKYVMDCVNSPVCEVVCDDIRASGAQGFLPDRVCHAEGSHSGGTPCLNARRRILYYETLSGQERKLARLAPLLIQAFKREFVTARVRLAGARVFRADDDRENRIELGALKHMIYLCATRHADEAERVTARCSFDESHHTRKERQLIFN